MQITEVKKYVPEIKEAMDRLIPQLSPDHISPSKEQLVEIIESPVTILFAAQNESGIIGFLSLILYRVPTGMKAWIEDVVVDRSERGRGTGEVLIRHAIEMAQTKGAKWVDLTSRPTRKAARQLYQKIGFRRRKTDVYRYDLA